VEGFLAALPRLDRGLVVDLLRGAPGIRDSEAPQAALAALVGAADASPEALRLALESDRIGAALGRTACCYDGGQLLDD
jgi:hypothetical protein